MNPLCKQVWFADDGTGCDSLEKLKKWWDVLQEEGPAFGYFPKASKSILIVKEGCAQKARKIFANSEIKIETQGSRHLGAAVGTSSFQKTFLDAKVKVWIGFVERLSLFAITQPHAAFSAFTRNLQSRWSFISRTVPDAADAFLPLEEAISRTFLPALLGRSVNPLERALLALPARFGGLGISNPAKLCEHAYAASRTLAAPLTDLIRKQKTSFDPTSLKTLQQETRSRLRKEADERARAELEKIERNASENLKLAIKIACEKGASCWLTARPLEAHSTILHKGDFRDAIRLRYKWQLSAPA